MPSSASVGRLDVVDIDDQAVEFVVEDLRLDAGDRAGADDLVESRAQLGVAPRARVQGEAEREHGNGDGEDAAPGRSRR